MTEAGEIQYNPVSNSSAKRLIVLKRFIKNMVSLIKAWHVHQKRSNLCDMIMSADGWKVSVTGGICDSASGSGCCSYQAVKDQGSFRSSKPTPFFFLKQTKDLKSEEEDLFVIHTQEASFAYINNFSISGYLLKQFLTSYWFCL